MPSTADTSAASPSPSWTLARPPRAMSDPTPRSLSDWAAAGEGRITGVSHPPFWLRLELMCGGGASLMAGEGAALMLIRLVVEEAGDGAVMADSEELELAEVVGWWFCGTSSVRRREDRRTALVVPPPPAAEVVYTTDVVVFCMLSLALAARE